MICVDEFSGLDEHYYRVRVGYGPAEILHLDCLGGFTKALLFDSPDTTNAYASLLLISSGLKAMLSTDAARVRNGSREWQRGETS
jgi:hypothetical protein